MAETKLLEGMYQQMYLIRRFELALNDLFKKGLLRGTVHCCIGQEAVAVGIIKALKKSDIITGNHRSHGHYLAYTDDVEGLLAEIMGKECGMVGGRGGSQHLHKDNFYSNGVQGALVPVAAGMAMAEKAKGSDGVVVCFMGDGTLGQGVVYESLNFAGLWQLPLIFVVENNYYAMSTPVNTVLSGDLLDRGRAFGLRCRETITNNVEEIYEQAAEIVATTRATRSPCYWVVNTYRTCGHSKSDDRCYRSREEERDWAEKDPLALAGGAIEENTRLKIERNCRQRMEHAIETVSKKAQPSTDSLSTGFFINEA
ncbi:MAG: thiamine pyrophosphate-dependent dehydrogenase E1 component subunit alpha [Thermodesulfobacteriota bacterium]|nr:thiamine pyrophosphate-dependent dehydrogenase E1 component subunit alpha [Thermodesulfobacteriota bacterium]